MKLLIIVPAYNEATVLSQTLKGIRKVTDPLGADLLVVDDGSVDETFQVAQASQVAVVRHVLNRGLGGAIGTGLEYAKRHKYDLAVTIDADGQHYPQDIKRLIRPIITQKAEVVIGSRFMGNLESMPPDRRFILFCSNSLTWILFGQKTSDSLSGFRAFGQRAIKSIQIKTERMEVSNEFFSEIKRLNLRLAEVPIKVIYTDYSKAKGQANSNAVNVIWKLLLRLFR